MTTPLTPPAHIRRTEQRTLEQEREAWWAAKNSTSADQDAALYAALKRSNRTRNAFIEFWCAEQVKAYGSISNALDRDEARRGGFSGNLTALSTYGRCLRKGWTPERIRAAEEDALLKVAGALGVDSSESEVRDLLLIHGYTSVQLAQLTHDALLRHLGGDKAREAQPYEVARDTSRALVYRADPDAPTAPQEADTLFHHAAQKMACANPQEWQAAVREARTGEPDTDTAGQRIAAENRKPPRFVDWGKQHGHDFISGDLPAPGEVYDAHHLPLEESEARTNGVQVLVFVSRRNHIPQPGGPLTAHSRLYSTRRPDMAAYALRYRAVQEARYEAHIRGEPDPYPAHLSVYLTLPEAA